MADTVNVEVVLAIPEKQVLLAFDVAPGTSVADVIALSGIEARFPDITTDDMPVGIWGKRVSRDRVVSAGDRVELYRALEIDPREARRQRALNEKG